MIARKFDKGSKNFLTAEEKKIALDAIENGFEDNYIWGLEAGGQMKNLRIKQVRGQIVEAEDFSGVTDTYP